LVNLAFITNFKLVYKTTLLTKGEKYGLSYIKSLL